MSDSPPDLPTDDIQPIGLADEMRKSYLDYAMSVIVSRALPDARDGLKPVHRRILHAMNESGYTPDKAFRKSARIIGEVMGKYHPHGNLAIYDAMVRLAQPFSLRVPLIDGQGNFGSVDGDPPAAERYTEARLSKPAMLLLEGIDEDTVDFQPNYDDSESEPRVLPAAFPNLLINGGSGIAVGMATNIPTHNAGEVIDAALALIADPLTPLDELMKIVPGPDFPTGGIIIGRSGIRAAYETGRGSITIRCRAEFEEVRKERTAIIVTEIPYQVNKAHMLERIAELVRGKQVEGIAEMRDESDRSGMRVVIECKRDATPEVVLNQLYRFSNLQISYGINMLALDGGRPRLLGLRDALQVFLRHREDVILRRSRFRLRKARDKAHELVGLAIAVANIDEMIVLIRTSPDPATARARMCERDWPASDVGALLDLIDEPGNHIAEDGTVRLTETQARAILDLRLQRLTGLEREKIDGELREIATRIAGLLALLSSQPQRMEVIRDELIEARKVLATPRQTAIADALTDQDDESLIEPGRMVVTITRDGFIKRTPLDAYRAQARGGRGRSGAATRGDDVVVRSFNAHTHQWVLFFTSGGKAFREKVWKLPEAGPNAKGRALVNLLPEVGSDETTAVLPLPQDETLWENLHLVFATASGGVRRNRLSDFRNMRASGLIAMKLDEGDRLIGVATCRDGDDVLLATRKARVIRFQIVDDVLRVFAGRDSTGVRGIRLAAGDAVISLCVLPHMAATPEERAAYLRHASAQRRRAGEETEAAEIAVEADGPVAVITLPPERLEEMERADLFLLTVTDQGFGKRTSAYEYRVTGRGGQGFANMGLSPRTGSEVVATLKLTAGDDVMLVTDAGQLIRTPGDQVRITGRQALGVTMLRVGAGERVTSVFPIVDEEPPAEIEATGEDDAPGASDVMDPTIVSDPFEVPERPEDPSMDGGPNADEPEAGEPE